VGRASAVLCVGLFAVAGCSRDAERYKITDSELVVFPQEGEARSVRVRPVTDNIIRVTAFPAEEQDLPASLMAVPSTTKVKFDTRQGRGEVVLETGALSARVSLTTGKVVFRDKNDTPIAEELDNGRTLKPVQIEGKTYYELRQQFSSPADEAFYGLGQHQSGLLNYKSADVELAQHNMDVGIPFVLSSRNYGILWDNNSITRFGDPREWQPLSASLKVYDASGKEGGLTATYSGKDVRLTRTEKDIGYQYIKDLKQLPTELASLPQQQVVWEGKIEASTSGAHKFTLYASDYHKLYIDGKPVIDAWRQNWNPWYRDFKVDMKAGEPRAIRIEWDRTSGYLALLHRDPLPAGEQDRLSLYSEAGHAIDYYFIRGANADEVISGYRRVTGKSTMLPRWAYGFWQSRERYKTQDELVGTVREYRRRKIPLDNIVQDWFYWKEDQWGSHEFDPERFPDPAGMVKQVHGLNARVMISVWPKFYPNTEHFKELEAAGAIYKRNLEEKEKDWVGPGYMSTFYDPYSVEGRKIYWRQINEKLNSLGFDAWWLDATEPDLHSNLDIEERKLRMGPTALGPSTLFFNSYSLPQAQGVYEGDRAANPDQRVFILTRSGFAGIQRYAAASWSGDIVSRWSDLKEQIAAGVGFSMSGTPNWTMDIGGFSLEPRYEKPGEKDLQEWRELNTRWFQFGAFCPLFRSHGQFPLREVWNIAPEGTEVYDTLVYYTRLRYRLMPYIYTVAADTYHRDYTMMRGLIMDFPNDPKVRDISDQYLFGPSLLVAPVYEYGARSRSVYLPAGTSWYDFYTGEKLEGGASVDAKAPLNRMPLFVKAGAIVPVGPEIQYTGEKPNAPLTLHVYTGQDGAFTLYEDDGTSYRYEKGEHAAIRFSTPVWLKREHSTFAGSPLDVRMRPT
jgi:alpha-D-xyloside xylohydrolase